MPRSGLTDRQIRQTKIPGVLIDGGGLRVKVTANSKTGELRKSWILRLTVKGQGVREMGLGSFSSRNGVAAARKRADDLRDRARLGIDPITHQKTELAAKAAEAARAITFCEAAEQYIDAHRSGWRNAKHRQQWANTLKTYVYPAFGQVPVGEVDQAMVMKALDPIWKKKTETASRLRGRIEVILDWASVRGYRRGDNPARWRGHLEMALPARSKAQKVRHHPALPFSEAPTFMADISGRPGIAPRAFAFAILTASRSSEAMHARWGEVDFASRAWTIPGERMKAAREHRVPLSAQALAILKTIKPKQAKPSDYVFPGPKTDKPLSNGAFLAVLRRMKREDLTPHGFRSTFRDWAAERTNYAREVAEAALAHTIGDKVEAAYRRGDLFEKRRRLMDAWAAYCFTPDAERSDVIHMNRRTI